LKRLDAVASTVTPFAVQSSDQTVVVTVTTLHLMGGNVGAVVLGSGVGAAVEVLLAKGAPVGTAVAFAVGTAVVGEAEVGTFVGLEVTGAAVVPGGRVAVGAGVGGRVIAHEASAYLASVTVMRAAALTYCAPARKVSPRVLRQLCV